MKISLEASFRPNYPKNQVHMPATSPPESELYALTIRLSPYGKPHINSDYYPAPAKPSSRAVKQSEDLYQKPWSTVHRGVGQSPVYTNWVNFVMLSVILIDKKCANFAGRSTTTQIAS